MQLRSGQLYIMSIIGETLLHGPVAERASGNAELRLTQTAQNGVGGTEVYPEDAETA
jgi:hypothetical protein